MKTPDNYVKLLLPDGRVILLTVAEIQLEFQSSRTKRKQFNKFIPKMACNNKQPLVY